MERSVERIRWARHATLAAASLGAIGTFLAIERTTLRHTGNRFDCAVMHAVGRRRSSLVTRLVRAVTALGSVPGALTITFAALALTRHRAHATTQIALGALGGIVAELGLKRIFRRLRPRMFEHLEVVTSSSFPSGHAMASSSLYLTVAFVASRGSSRRVALVSAASALATSVGLTRVYLGVHWPTDVLGGLALGTAWACATEAGFDWAEARRVATAAELGGNSARFPR